MSGRCADQQWEPSKSGASTDVILLLSVLLSCHVATLLLLLELVMALHEAVVLLLVLLL